MIGYLPPSDLLDRDLPGFATGIILNLGSEIFVAEGLEYVGIVVGDDVIRTLLMTVNGSADNTNILFARVEKEEGFVMGEAILVRSDDQRGVRVNLVDLEKLPEDTDWIEFFCENHLLDPRLVDEITIEQIQSDGIARTYLQSWMGSMI